MSEESSKADSPSRAGIRQSLFWTTTETLPDDHEALLKVRELCDQLPASISSLTQTLNGKRHQKLYDPLTNVAIEAVWKSRHTICGSIEVNDRIQLFLFAATHMWGSGKSRILRQLANDPARRVRERVMGYIRLNPVHEVGLPRPVDKQFVNDDPNWDSTGWFYNRDQRGLLGRKRDTGIAQRLDLPKLDDNSQVCEILNIKSKAQLGYLLTATDEGNGPYRKFEIAKRNGGSREICAPKDQLRWVQRRILRNILNLVPVSTVAHGFVQGRSTVSNAALHVGKPIIVKFDLVNFFSSISYYRVVGLFGSLGYHVGDTKFSSHPEHRNIAAVLGRLCCYTPNPKSWEQCFLPQGAPTSPAITNLICRALDARLNGLARQYGGQYSRYADDLTFSFDDPTVKVGKFRWWVDQICQQEGFTVNQEKFRAIRSSQKQTVTGIVVNDCLRVDRRLRRKMRAIVHNCERNGVEKESRGELGFLSHLLGVASYIHMIHPEEGRDLLDRIGALGSNDSRNTRGGING